MHKNLKKTAKSPRYITITIQYYPVNIKLLVTVFFVLFAWPLLSLGQLIWHTWFSYSFVGNIYAAEKFNLSYAYSLAEEKKAREDEYSHALYSKPTGEVISHGPRDSKHIALTFDADMTPGMKEDLLSGKVSTYYDTNTIKILTETQTKATIFMAGMWIEMYPEATKELAANPLFELSNHSYSHPSFDGNCFGLGEIPDELNREQIHKTQSLLQSVGVTNTYFRFPGGCYSQNDLDILKDVGLSVVHWDVVGYDGFNHDSASIENNIIPHVQNGSIIVLHLGGAPNTPQTANVLPTIIAQLKEKGFEFVKVSELLTKKESRPSTVRLPLILSSRLMQ